MHLLFDDLAKLPLRLLVGLADLPALLLDDLAVPPYFRPHLLQNCFIAPIPLQLVWHKQLWESRLLKGGTDPVVPDDVSIKLLVS